MPSQILRFETRQGIELVGRLDTPDDCEPKAFAIFGHCFTCTRNLKSIGRISRGLNSQCYAVARFDFTGLGDSGGDFSQTNFTSNVEDLLDAAAFISKQYEPPRILVGHSFGGAASLMAATKLESCAGVVAIAAPSEPFHVLHSMGGNVEQQLEMHGHAEVDIGGRSYTLRRQFLDDVREIRLRETISKLSCAKFIIHSPLDKTVGIENATEIFAACKHPKSFLSLDKADHLLTDPADAEYVGRMIGMWASRYL